METIKKILKSFLKFFLLSALVHIVVLIISAIKNRDIKYLNYFRIIGLEEFWPRISNTHISDLVSAIFIITIIFCFFAFSLKNKIKI
jgi:hypothetical protein